MPGISVVVPSRSSPFRRALSGALVARLRAQGAEVDECGDRLPDPGRVGLVLDPHDGLERIASGPEISRFLQRAIVLSTAAGPDGRPRDRAFIEAAAATAVTSPLHAGRLTSEGYRVELVGIGFDPSYVAEEVPGGRSNDVAVLLPATRERGRLVAQLGAVLAGRPHEIRLDYTRDLIGRSATELALADRRRLLARSRVVVFIPDERDRPCLDWLHLHDVFANGCCVVTSRTMDLGSLVPSEHVVTAGPSSLALVLEALLADPELERRTGDAGRAHVEEVLALDSAASAVLDLAGTLASAGGRRFIPHERQRALPEVDGATAEIVARIALENAELRQGVRLAVAASTTESAGYRSVDPEISVVVPLRNYGQFVELAIESALASTAIAIEVVVVDDASTDDSVARVSALLDRRPESAILLRSLGVQGGLGAARNHGFRLARAPLVFTLDADDLLYPEGLARLVRALEADPAAAFAYGIVEWFDVDGPLDLGGTQGFDVGLFAFGNYLPAMALIRKDAWQVVGGYPEGGIFQLGWEDFEFWLRLVEAGRHGTWTPSLVLRYRRHAGSMLRLTDIVAPTLDTHIRAEHPAIFAAAAT